MNSRRMSGSLRTHLYCIANGHQRTAEEVAADVYPERQERKQGSKRVAKKGSAEKGLEALGAQLKELVKSGKLTGKEAMELYQAASGK